MNEKWLREDLLHEWEFIQEHDVVLAAPRLGMTVDALDRALHRALNDGDPRGRHKCTRHRARLPRECARCGQIRPYEAIGLCMVCHRNLRRNGTIDDWREKTGRILTTARTRMKGVA